MLTRILLCVSCVAILAQETNAAMCACATTTVSIRSGPGAWTSRIGKLTAQNCLPYLNMKETAVSYTWARVNRNGRIGWIVDDYLRIRTCPDATPQIPAIPKPESQCVCAKRNVDIRSGPGTGYSKVGRLTKTKCVTYLNSQRVGSGYTWAKVSSNGTTAWIAVNWLRVRSCPYSTGGCFDASDIRSLQDKLIEYAGIRYKVYDALPGNSFKAWTICVGFKLTTGSSRSEFNKILPAVNFDSVYAGRKTLNKQQCLALFQYRLATTYIPRAKRLAGIQFCGLQLNVKIALVNAAYRGDLMLHDPAARYMRAGNWCAVRKEYLNYRPYMYKNCRPLGIPAVCTRMDWNAAQFQTMCR